MPISRLVAVLCILVLGCEGSTAPMQTKAPRWLWMPVAASEGDATQIILGLGDTAYAELFRSPDDSTCGCLVPYFDGTFSRADTNIVRLEPVAMLDTTVGRARAGHAVRLIARQYGSTFFSAGIVPGPGLYVAVVWPPIPVDSVRAQLVASAYSGDSLTTDAAGNVVSVAFPLGESVGFTTTVFRGNAANVYLPGTITSSDPSVAQVSMDSFPSSDLLQNDAWGGRVCWGCRVGQAPIPGADWFFVSGVAPGTASITVTARNRRYVFAVTVR